MGEYADMEVARQQRAGGRERMRELFEQTEAQRKAAGREEEAHNQAIHDAREKALAEGLAAVAGPALAVGLIVERAGKYLAAKLDGSLRGQWWPDKRPTIRGRKIPCCSATAWLERLLR